MTNLPNVPVNYIVAISFWENKIYYYLDRTAFVVLMESAAQELTYFGIVDMLDNWADMRLHLTLLKSSVDYLNAIKVNESKN